MSEVYLQPDGPFRREVIEHLNYDGSDFIGDIGGNLGLFLGWSLISISFYLPVIFRLLRSLLTTCPPWKHKPL